jgi:hypothetical protein
MKVSKEPETPWMPHPNHSRFSRTSHRIPYTELIAGIKEGHGLNMLLHPNPPHRYPVKVSACLGGSGSHRIGSKKQGPPAHQSVFAPTRPKTHGTH